ncbi:hypothetical protein HHI36_000313 [Cryptolaemus montrouzieri]|uniref:tRNA/rRNA methyltransferase SpoU type domain-containing protein n=1 Tax=Cryptolaemus montrouzieri TaxID=559131 RepID=A0ABD2P4T0_9CUCU
MLKITINLDAGHTYSNICDILILFSDVIGRTDILRYLLDRFDLSELPVTQFPWMNYPYVPDLLDKALAEPSLVPIETDLIKSNFPRSNFKDLRILVLQMIKSGNYMEYKGEDYYKLWLRGIRYCLDSFYDDTEIAKLIEKFKLLLDVGYPKFTRLVAENLDLLPKYASTRKLSESIHIYDYCLRRICLLPNTYSKPFSVIFFRAVLHFNLLSSEIFIDYWKSWYSSLFEEHFLECDIVMKVILEGCRKLIQLEAPNMCIFAPLILTGLKNGIVVKKNQRVEYGICQDISHVIENFSSNNPNFIAMELKMLAMESLYLLSKMENSLMKPDKLVGILMEMYKENFKIRYFPGSKIHLEKLRICQAFLMLVHSVTSSKHQFIQFILDTFSEESHQPSVKHLLQWLLIILLSSNPVEHFCILVEKINTASLSHPSFVIALIPVLYHLVLLMNDSKFWFEVTDTLLPWTMGANFKLRVYCQVALKELLKKAQERQLTEYINKYSFLESTFMKVLECTGTSVEDTMKFDLFFIETFDPKLHFSMENIFIKIPKSLDVPSYEWENIKDYEFSKKFDMKIWNEPDFPIYTKTETIEVEDNIEASGMNVQKKIIPWKSALDETVNNRILGNLICVASLVDKSSNLGGLSRTCEVFSIRQLVLHNCKIIDDKEFKSLSMSSENWVEFIEVKRDDLSNFLTKMKQDGYSLIGLEQTSESQKLHEFKFPEKIVLLLGNEKEGISAPLLPLLDSCVEIPQFGQTRSLNVHVAGATFIWEYVRQRLSPTQKT